MRLVAARETLKVHSTLHPIIMQAAGRIEWHDRDERSSAIARLHSSAADRAVIEPSTPLMIKSELD